MDKSIPAAAGYILDGISQPESNGDYNVFNGFVQAKLPKKLTKMTLQEVLGIDWKSIGANSSAAGRYQIIRETLYGLIAELGLKRTTLFSADLQDRLAYHLLRRRGYDAWTLGKIDTTEFGKRLAMEWASLPVLAGTKNYKGKNIKRGTSYYAGDGLNSHGITADQFEDMLEYAFNNEERFNVQQTTPTKTSKTTGTVLVAAGAAVGSTGGAIAVDNADSLPDIGTISIIAGYAKDAWVVGPVFGGVVLAAVLIGGIIWWRNRQH